jgi:hypothetical protein
VDVCMYLPMCEDCHTVNLAVGLILTVYESSFVWFLHVINPLVPSDPHMGRTAPLTSRCCILNTYSTNIRTEYFKRAA